MRVVARLVAALGLLGGVAVLLARLAPTDLPSSAADVPSWLAAGPVDARVVALATLAAYGCLAWLAFVLVAVAVGAFPRGAVRDAAERVLGVAMVGVAAGALVAGPAAADGPFDRAADPAPSRARPPTSAPNPRPPERVVAPTRPVPVPTSGPDGAVVVAPGDTLWGIAARRLGAAASPALTAATWPRWYAANRPLIGPDPGRILPGQRLVPPDDGGTR